MTASAVSAGLDKVALFQGLSPQQLSRIAPMLRRRTFPAGTNLMTVEQPGEVIYIILTGTVKIHVEQADGSDVILSILGAGETVGEMSLADGSVRSATVITLEPTSVLWMDRRNFQRCLQTVPELTYNLARILSRRLRLANDQIQALAALDVYGRVARQLVAFAREYGLPDDNGDLLIPIRLTQSDVADLVGASRVRVNQVLIDYRHAGYLSISRAHHITLHNQAALIDRYE